MSKIVCFTVENSTDASAAVTMPLPNYVADRFLRNRKCQVSRKRMNQDLCGFREFTSAGRDGRIIAHVCSFCIFDLECGYCA